LCRDVAQVFDGVRFRGFVGESNGAGQNRLAIDVHTRDVLTGHMPETHRPAVGRIHVDCRRRGRVLVDRRWLMRPIGHPSRARPHKRILTWKTPRGIDRIPQMAVGPRHSALVRVTHWITAFAFAALLVSGVEILISHPRFYWGETGN